MTHSVQPENSNWERNAPARKVPRTWNSKCVYSLCIHASGGSAAWRERKSREMPIQRELPCPWPTRNIRAQPAAAAAFLVNDPPATRLLVYITQTHTLRRDEYKKSGRESEIIWTVSFLHHFASATASLSISIWLLGLGCGSLVCDARLEKPTLNSLRAWRTSVLRGCRARNIMRGCGRPCAII
jgi:hypothetical protein